MKQHEGPDPGTKLYLAGATRKSDGTRVRKRAPAAVGTWLEQRPSEAARAVDPQRAHLIAGYFQLKDGREFAGGPFERNRLIEMEGFRFALKGWLEVGRKGFGLCLRDS